MERYQVQLAQEAYATAADFIDNYIDNLSSTPRHIIRNHAALEVMRRIKEGIDQKRDLVAFAVEAALSEVALQSFNTAEVEAKSHCN
jgi:hypothetical protein